MSGGAQNTVTARKIDIFTTMCPRAGKHMVKMRAKPIRGGLTAPKPRFSGHFSDFLALPGQNSKKNQEFEQGSAGYDPQVVAMHTLPLAARLSGTARGSAPER